jgi:hypothetical protein
MGFWGDLISALSGNIVDSCKLFAVSVLNHFSLRLFLIRTRLEHAFNLGILLDDETQCGSLTANNRVIELVELGFFLDIALNFHQDDLRGDS